MNSATHFPPAIVEPMGKAADLKRVSVDFPPKLHERFFQRCRFKLGGISMNKRILQLVMADMDGRIEVPHDPGAKNDAAGDKRK